MILKAKEFCNLDFSHVKRTQSQLIWVLQKLLVLYIISLGVKKKALFYKVPP